MLAKKLMGSNYGLGTFSALPRVTCHLVIAPSLDRAQRRQRPLVLVEAVVAQHAALQPDQAQALSKARLKRVSSADQFREGG